jgi:hypothetical protein
MTLTCFGLILLTTVLHVSGCCRTRNCLNLYNVTLVVATEQELDYMMFMFSMFNSPLPNMRQHAKWYETELKMTNIQVRACPVCKREIMQQKDFTQHLSAKRQLPGRRNRSVLAACHQRGQPLVS